MGRLISRSFVNAQAFVGVMLTVSWLSGDLDLQATAISLYSIAALLFMYSLVPAQWTRSPDRLDGPLALDTAARQMSKQLHLPEDTQRLGDFAAQHKFSIQLVLTSGFLCATALLLQHVVPTPSI